MYQGNCCMLTKFCPDMRGLLDARIHTHPPTHTHAHTHIILICRAKLHQNAALVQVPIGLESGHEGVVDIIRNRAVYFTGEYG